MVKKIKIKNRFIITGRGLVLNISLKENGFSRDLGSSEVFDLRGEQIDVDGRRYLVRSIECGQTLMTSPVLTDGVGLIVRPVIIKKKSKAT